MNDEVFEEVWFQVGSENDVYVTRPWPVYIRVTDVFLTNASERITATVYGKLVFRADNGSAVYEPIGRREPGIGEYKLVGGEFAGFPVLNTTVDAEALGERIA